MGTDPSVVGTPPHPRAVHDIYDGMLRAAGGRSRFVDRASGARVHVAEAGSGDPVVHLHGTNTSSLSHLMLVQRMRSTRSLLVDRPGCGLSDPTTFEPGRFREHAVHFLDDVLDALELDSATLVGASGGGIWATWYALTRPGRVRGLVMLGSVPALPGVRIPLPLRVMATPLIGDALARRVKAGRRTIQLLMSSVGEGHTIGQHPDLLESLVAGAHDPVAVAANLAELRALMSPFGWRRSMRITDRELQALAVPTLMIWGDHDPVVSVAHARAAAALIPDARLEVVAAGHVPQLGNPDLVAELIEGFTHARR